MLKKLETKLSRLSLVLKVERAKLISVTCDMQTISNLLLIYIKKAHARTLHVHSRWPRAAASPVLSSVVLSGCNARSAQICFARKRPCFARTN